MTESSSFSGASKYTLADRPKWWLPRVMKWLTILSVLFALILWLSSMLLEVFMVAALNGDEGSEAFTELVYFTDEAALAALGVLFYAGIFWLVSLAVDKVDQLVWLNASDEDRDFILQKRKRKNAKNK